MKVGRGDGFTTTYYHQLPSARTGEKLCGFIKRKACKVRSRTMNITNWLQVNGRRTKYAIRIRFPYAMRDAIKAACGDVTKKFEKSEIRTFRYIWPTKAIEWLQTGIPEDEEGN